MRLSAPARQDYELSPSKQLRCAYSKAPSGLRHSFTRACTPSHIAEAQTRHLTGKVSGLDSYALAGDSFGAVISLAIAVRRPAGLKTLVISGGFARNPITSPLLKMLAGLAPFFPGPFYRGLTLRMHAFNLRSKFGSEVHGPNDVTPSSVALGIRVRPAIRTEAPQSSLVLISQVQVPGSS